MADHFRAKEHLVRAQTNALQYLQLAPNVIVTDNDNKDSCVGPLINSHVDVIDDYILSRVRRVSGGLQVYYVPHFVFVK